MVKLSIVVIYDDIDDCVQAAEELVSEISENGLWNKIEKVDEENGMYESVEIVEMSDSKTKTKK